MRKVSNMIRAGRGRALNAVVAGVLAVGMVPLPAFASDLAAGDAELDTQASMSADGLVIGAAFAAAEPAPDILGLSNPEQRNDAKVTDMKLVIFGSDINEAPDPYFANTLAYLQSGEDATPRIITDKRASQSPMSNRLAYAGDSSASDQVWELLPDVVLGTGNDNQPAGYEDDESAFYDTDAYARAVETAKGLPANSYHPIAVTYNRVNLNTMIDTMYKMAAAGDKVVAADSSKSLRYGTAMDIARDYERYVTGTKAYVRQQIDAGVVPLRTVASIQSYDADASTYKIIDDGATEGTATQNRALEAVQGVAVNYFTVSDATPEVRTVTTNQGPQDVTVKTVTADELQGVDLLMLGGQAVEGQDDIVEALSSDGLLAKTYYCTNMNVGSIFGVTVNSVENAQNVGRIVPCLYPELLDQSDMMAYYYDHFYHLKSSAIGPTIDTYMDGVRNWDATDSSAYLQWSADDVADYDEAEVEALLAQGVSYVSYIKNETDDADELGVLATTDNLTEEPEFEYVYIQPIETQVTTGEALTPELTVLYGKYELVAGEDYEAAYSNNVEAGTGTVTLTGKGKFEGTLTATFDIVDSQFSRLFGDIALDTMAAIVDEGNFDEGGTVVLTTFSGYWDALTAAGIAGQEKAPVLMTMPSSLSDQTADQLKKLAPSKIIVCGGTSAMPEAVVAEAQEAAGTDPEVVRCAGQTATGTAVDIFNKGDQDLWSDAAFVCTNEGYWDALAASPISYANGMAIFLTEGKSDISQDTLDAMTAGGIKRVYLVGGTAAITSSVEDKIKDAGIEVADRLWGDTAIETSEKVAEYGLSTGMSALKMGVATNGGYWDALAGAPLLGKNNSVLVLVADQNSDSISGFVAKHKSEIGEAYVFGGPNAISNATHVALTEAVAL